VTKIVFISTQQIPQVSYYVDSGCTQLYAIQVFSLCAILTKSGNQYAFSSSCTSSSITTLMNSGSTSCSDTGPTPTTYATVGACTAVATSGQDSFTGFYKATCGAAVPTLANTPGLYSTTFNYATTQNNCTGQPSFTIYNVNACLKVQGSSGYSLTNCSSSTTTTSYFYSDSTCQTLTSGTSTSVTQCQFFNQRFFTCGFLPLPVNTNGSPLFKISIVLMMILSIIHF